MQLYGDEREEEAEAEAEERNVMSFRFPPKYRQY
jgi:hypothetical protein